MEELEEDPCAVKNDRKDRSLFNNYRLKLILGNRPVGNRPVGNRGQTRLKANLIIRLKALLKILKRSKGVLVGSYL